MKFYLNLKKLIDFENIDFIYYYVIENWKFRPTKSSHR